MITQIKNSMTHVQGLPNVYVSTAVTQKKKIAKVYISMPTISPKHLEITILQLFIA
jgi:hypothetical protein